MIVDELSSRFTESGQLNCKSSFYPGQAVLWSPLKSSDNTSPVDWEIKTRIPSKMIEYISVMSPLGYVRSYLFLWQNRLSSLFSEFTFFFFRMIAKYLEVICFFNNS